MPNPETMWKDHVYHQRYRWLCLILQPLSLLYRSATEIKKWWSRREGTFIDPSGVRVVCVGNLTVGGSGKTPFCLWLIDKLLKADKHVRLVSRGYGARFSSASAHYRLKQWDRPGFFGDEVGMLIARFPNIEVDVGVRRAAFARQAAEESEPPIMLYDDALQYWRLGRDLDFVVIHWGLKWGNGGIFPAGPLRESLKALERASAMIITHAPADLQVWQVREFLHGLQTPIYFLDCSSEGLFQGGREFEVQPGQKFSALAGIAHPHDFFEDLEALGISLISCHVLRDHERLSLEQENRILDHLSPDEYLIVTEKDAARLQSQDERILVLRQNVVLRSGEDEFLRTYFGV